MPVLPLVHSRMIESGRNNPRRSASVITAAANRSLMLPLGLRNSHLAWSDTPSGSKYSRTVGVSPTKPSTALARDEFMAPSQTEFRLHFGKGADGEFQVFARMRGGDLRPNTSLAFGHDRIGKADDVHALPEHLVGDPRRQRGIAQQDRHNRMR